MLSIYKFIEKVFRRINFLFPDKLYLGISYYLNMGKRLDLNNPQTMNEKLQWLKLFNRKPEYKQMVDKLLAKEYISKLIGNEYIVPTLGVWDCFEEIDFERLPNRFVLKTNHGGGNTGVVICANKSTFNKETARKKLNKSLGKDIYKEYREWPYKDIQKKIFAEELLGEGCDDIVDYKFYCFDGFVDSVLLCVDRQIGDPKFYFFDQNWQLKRHNKRGKEAPENFTLPKPENMDKMFELASKLSKGIPFLRVDLYNVNGKIYFGETTFFPASGYDANRLPEADYYFGQLITLPKSSNSQ